MSFLKKIASMAAKTVEPIVKKAQPSSAPVGGPGAGMGLARRGLFGKAIAGGIAKGFKGFRFKDGGSVTASRPVVSSGRGDGAAIRGKTKCKMY